MSEPEGRWIGGEAVEIVVSEGLLERYGRDWHVSPRTNLTSGGIQQATALSNACIGR